MALLAAVLTALSFSQASVPVGQVTQNGNSYLIKGSSGDTYDFGAWMEEKGMAYEAQGGTVVEGGIPVSQDYHAKALLNGENITLSGTGTGETAPVWEIRQPSDSATEFIQGNLTVTNGANFRMVTTTPQTSSWFSAGSAIFPAHGWGLWTPEQGCFWKTGNFIIRAEKKSVLDFSACAVDFSSYGGTAHMELDDSRLITSGFFMGDGLVMPAGMDPDNPLYYCFSGTGLLTLKNGSTWSITEGYTVVEHAKVIVDSSTIEIENSFDFFWDQKDVDHVFGSNAVPELRLMNGAKIVKLGTEGLGEMLMEEKTILSIGNGVNTIENVKLKLGDRNEYNGEVYPVDVDLVAEKGENGTLQFIGETGGLEGLRESSLNKIGAGTVTLSGKMESYVGHINVKEGGLKINGAIVNSSVNIKSGATLEFLMPTLISWQLTVNNGATLFVNGDLTAYSFTYEGDGRFDLVFRADGQGIFPTFTLSPAKRSVVNYSDLLNHADVTLDITRLGNDFVLLKQVENSLTLNSLFGTGTEVKVSDTQAQFTLGLSDQQKQDSAFSEAASGLAGALGEEAGVTVEVGGVPAPVVPDPPAPPVQEGRYYVENDFTLNSMWTSASNLKVLSRTGLDQITTQRLSASRTTNVWVSGLGDFVNHSISGDRDGFDYSGGGYGAGADWVWGNQLKGLAGVSFGQMFGDLKSKLDSDIIKQQSLMVSLYGGTQWMLSDKDTVILKGSAGYGQSDNDWKWLGRKLTDWTDDVWALSASLDWRRKLNDAWTFIPTFGLTFDHVTQNSFNTGNYSRTDGKMDNLSLNAGVGMENLLKFQNGTQWVNTVSLRYIGDVYRNNPYARGTMDDVSYKFIGSAPARNAFNAEWSSRYFLNEMWSLFASYSVEARSAATGQSVNAGVSCQF